MDVTISWYMLALGDFRFSIDTAAYHSLSRTTSYKWPSQDRLWNDSTIQYTGRSNDDITLTADILPEFRGGYNQVEKLRLIAQEGKPLPLNDGNGRYMGKWCIVDIKNTDSEFSSFGEPRVMELTMTLRKYAEDL